MDFLEFFLRDPVKAHANRKNNFTTTRIIYTTFFMLWLIFRFFYFLDCTKEGMRTTKTSEFRAKVIWLLERLLSDKPRKRCI